MPHFQIEKVIDGLLFPEGPAYDGKGNLAVSNCKADYVTQVNAAGEARVLYRAAPDGFQKTNGMTYHRSGALFACDFGRNAIVAIGPDAKVYTIADRCDGLPFKGPNDLAFDPDGHLYFTDPAGSSEHKPIGCVYRVDATDKGKVTKVAEGLAFPNGLAFSADGSHLYVAESRTFSILRFRVKKDGTLNDKHTHARLPTDHDPDGINFDADGNLWVAQFGAAAVRHFDPKGQLIRSVQIPGKNVTNVEFAGKDLRTLYITEAETGTLFKMQVDTPGLPLFCAPDNNP